MIDFALTDEQKTIVETVRDFVRRELMPHDDEVERLGHVPDELAAEIRRKSLDAGLYAMNMPVELGGGGLDYVTQALCTEQFARAGSGLSVLVHQPTPILLACEGALREEYLLPTIRGERSECFALTEPGAGSDARAIQTRAVRDGGDWIVNGTKQFISHADHADFIIAFAVTGQDESPRGPRSRITAFLVDKDLPGVDVQPVEVVSLPRLQPAHHHVLGRARAGGQHPRHRGARLRLRERLALLGPRDARRDVPRPRQVHPGAVRRLGGDPPARSGTPSATSRASRSSWPRCRCRSARPSCWCCTARGSWTRGR